MIQHQCRIPKTDVPVHYERLTTRHHNGNKTPFFNEREELLQEQVGVQLMLQDMRAPCQAASYYLFPKSIVLKSPTNALRTSFEIVGAAIINRVNALAMFYQNLGVFHSSSADIEDGGEFVR